MGSGPAMRRQIAAELCRTGHRHHCGARAGLLRQNHSLRCGCITPISAAPSAHQAPRFGSIAANTRRPGYATFPSSAPRCTQRVPSAHGVLSMAPGFETVDEAEKTARVGEVFSRTAPNYDLMNDLMSGGVHHLWKDRRVKLSSS